MRSKFRPAVLLVLALLIGMVAAAACGGTHAGSPCCSATGAVQQPTAFAATTPTLMAEPILFPSQATSCLTFDPANGLTLPAGTSSLGAPQPVVAGRYTVKISGKAIGDQIYIRIFDAAAPKATLAVGAVPADQASHTDAADPYHVAPIAIDPLALAVDESTLELLVWCDLLQNSLAGILHSAIDMRAEYVAGGRSGPR